MIILNFHGVGPLLREVDPGERDCWLDTEQFEEILDHVRGDARVALTFDDGNSSDHDIVLPALKRRGLKAMFFICSGRLDTPTFLSTAQVREMRTAGMEIGSHGVAHVPWRHLDRRLLENELEVSRRSLTAACASPIVTAACPFGSYDSRVLKALRGAGYRVVMTSDGGPCSPRRTLLSRNTVRRSFTLADVDRLLASDARPLERLACFARVSVKRHRPAPLRKRPVMPCGG